MIAQNDLAADFSIALTSSVGRGQEMADVKRLLSNIRLLSLIGPLGYHKPSRKHLDCASSPIVRLWRCSRISSYIIAWPQEAHP